MPGFNNPIRFDLVDPNSTAESLRAAFSLFEFIDLVELANSSYEKALQIVKIFCDPQKSVYTRPGYFDDGYHGGRSPEEDIVNAQQYLIEYYLDAKNRALTLMLYKDPGEDRYIGAIMAGVYHSDEVGPIVWRETKILDPDYDKNGKQEAIIEDSYNLPKNSLDLSLRFDSVYTNLARKYGASWIVTEESRHGECQGKSSHELRLGLEQEGFFAVIDPIRGRRIAYRQPEHDFYDLFIKNASGNRSIISREELIEIFSTMHTQGWTDTDYSAEQKERCIIQFASELGDSQEFHLVPPTQSLDRV